MNRNFTLFFVLKLIGMAVNAQSIERSIVSSFGFSYAGSGFQTDCTIGEVITFTGQSENSFLTQGLDEVMKISPVTYHYIEKTGHDTSVEHVGVIAQDLQKISPNMVSESEMELVDGTKGNYLSVDPSAFTYMLINSIQEQQKQIEAQQKQIDELKKEVVGLNSR